MYGASIFSDCSSDEEQRIFNNEFLSFIQTDEREKLEEINASIINKNL